MLAQIWQFVVAVARHWGALVTGGFIVGLIAVIEHVQQKSISGWPLWIAIIISLFVAFLLVWRNERRNVIALTDKLHDPIDEKVHRVAEFINQGYELIGSVPKRDTTHEVIAEWREKLTAWTRETYDFLHASSVQASLKFINTSGMISRTFHVAHPDINNDLDALDRRMGNLNQILEKPETYLR